MTALVAGGLSCGLPALAAGARIDVSTDGSGPDVILIPGLASSPDVWAGLVKAVPGYRYHLVQVSGFSGADVAGNAEGLVAAGVAEEIASYVTANKLTRPTVIGHSMGGTIAMMLAARHPDAVGRLMVVDMMPFMGAMFGPPGTTAESIRPTADQFRDQMLSASQADYDQQQLATLDTMINTKPELPYLVRHARTSDRGVSARSMHELIITDLRPELSNITAPTTVLYVHTPAYPVSAGMLDMVYRFSFANLTGAKLVRIPDSAHFIMQDQPARFQAEVKALLAEPLKAAA